MNIKLINTVGFS